MKDAPMFPKNLRLGEIEKRNKAMLEAAESFRRDLKKGKASINDLPTLKKQYPAFGIMPCKAAGIEFVMFHAHDDLVVWEYLWLGADAYEKELVNTWVSWCRSPSVVLDIGAYSGLMSLLAARANPETQVHLFEPLERILERANVNVKLNGLGQRIKRHAVAASDTDGRVEINLYRDENTLGTGSSIDPKAGKEGFGTKVITTVAIDDYLPDIVPTAVKVDVEGHELACLRGMEKTIARARPKMLVEVWEHTRTEVMQLLDDHGYTLKRHEPVDRPVNNFIALPRS